MDRLAEKENKKAKQSEEIKNKISIENAIKLLTRLPTIEYVYFSPNELTEDRQNKINQLSEIDRKAILLIVKDLICRFENDPNLPNLIDYIPSANSENANAAYVISHDFQLIKLYDSEVLGDAIYDFNGWPGDNQDGNLMYYNSKQNLFTEIAYNGDAMIEFAEGFKMLDKGLKKYEVYREDIEVIIELKKLLPFDLALIILDY